MKYFNHISSLLELKLRHRRLAMLNHPDRGGDDETMKCINNEYHLVKQRLMDASYTFRQVAVGDVVVINSSYSKVVKVFPSTFYARSSLTGRLAEFSKANGVCRSNPKFKAVFQKSY